MSGFSDMKRYGLLSHDFRFLCCGNGEDDAELELVTCDIALKDLGRIACLAQYAGRYGLVISPGQGERPSGGSWYDFERKTFARPVPGGHLSLERHEQKEGFCRLFYGQDSFFSLGTAHSEIEEEDGCFRLVSWEEMQALQILMRHRWVIGPEAQTGGVACADSTNEIISFCGLPVLYRELLHAWKARKAGDEFFFFSGDDLYRAVRFRPALFYVLFGARILEQLMMALQSVVDPGAYEGDIFIVSDMAEDYLRDLMPKTLKARLHFITMKGYDMVDYISARQTLLSNGILDDYNPVIYTDVDVTVNVPLEPLMARAALERKISAQLEFFQPDFREAESNGKTFFQADRFPVDKVEAGFNSGVLLVPEIKEQRRYLDPSFYTNIVYNYDHGRGSVQFNEQSVMNYSLRKLGAFDGTFISDVTEIGGNTDSYIVIHYGKMDPAKAAGFAHFWCTGEPRHHVMARYLGRLRRYNARN